MKRLYLATAWALLALPLVLLSASARAEEWNQWRGPHRNGLDTTSPKLIDELPQQGLRPLWISEEIPAGNVGGWGSPVVSQGRVYLFAHLKNKQGDPPQKKFPWLPPDKRGGMSDAEYQEYEAKRRDEDEQLSRFFDFRERVYCLDGKTGQTLWVNERPSVYCRFMQSGSPAVIDGKLYILGAGRVARCIDAANGKDLWEVRLPGEFRDEYMMSSFAVADGVAVVLCGHLFGLDAQTGKILWEGDRSATSGTHSSPAVWKHQGQEFVIVHVGNEETICIEPRTGKELWRVQSQARMSTPVIAGDLMITLGDSRKKGLRCFELSPQGAKQRWAYQGLADKGASPVVVGDFVYAQGEKRMACVNLKTGKAAWSTTLDLATPQYTSLVAGDNKVFYACDGLLMFAASDDGFNPLFQAKMNREALLASEALHRQQLKLDEVEKGEGGLEKAQQIYNAQVEKAGPLPCATPALNGGLLYVRTPQGIVCYDLRANGSDQGEAQ